MAAKKGKQQKGNDGPWVYEGVECLKKQPEDELVFDFGNTDVLVTHASINGGEAVRGIFTGNWSTARVDRTTFRVTDVAAQLVLPSLDLLLPDRKRAVRTQPGSIYLSKNTFAVPKHLAGLFPSPNEGTVEPRSRFYSAVFGMHIAYPFAYRGTKALKLEPASALLRTSGYVQRDGSLVASGIGTIISGFLGGLMFACGHGSKKPVKPAKCGAVEPGTTWKCTLKPHTGGGHANAYSGHTWN